MHLVLDPAQDAAHGDWLRRMPGAYEWWYFDAVSEDGDWALTCIWFLGNPFSPYYRLAARKETTDPFSHNALFFALYHQGRLHAYHFTRFPRTQACADESQPATLRFGPNILSFDGTDYHLQLTDENQNRRTLTVDLLFRPPARSPGAPDVPHRPPELGTGEDHFWLPAAPVCKVSGTTRLQERQNRAAQVMDFSGRGYHDHNWGKLPFALDIRDWYWARTALSDDRAMIVYHVNYHFPRPSVSHLLLFENGRLLRHDPEAQVTLGRERITLFGTGYATRLSVRSGDLTASFSLDKRLDSSPFYVRTLSHGEVSLAGNVETGAGMAEYFRPRLLSAWLTASATKARIVER